MLYQRSPISVASLKRLSHHSPTLVSCADYKISLSRLHFPPFSFINTITVPHPQTPHGVFSHLSYTDIIILNHLIVLTDIFRLAAPPPLLSSPTPPLMSDTSSYLEYIHTAAGCLGSDTPGKTRSYTLLLSLSLLHVLAPWQGTVTLAGSSSLPQRNSSSVISSAPRLQS